MNKTRRKEIKAVSRLIENLKDQLASFGELKETLAAIGEEIERIRDAEQEAYENLPGNQQDGERGGDMQAAIGELETALAAVEGFVEALEVFDEDCTDDAVRALDEAAGAEE